MILQGGRYNEQDSRNIRKESFHDDMFYDNYLKPKQKLINLPNGKQVVDEPTDHQNTNLLYNLFSHSLLAKNSLRFVELQR